MRQLNQQGDIFAETGKDSITKFGIKVELMNANDVVKETYILKDCIVTNIAHSEPTMGDDDNADISVTVDYDNIDVKVFDRYITLTKGN
jgi:hypothetical protein